MSLISTQAYCKELNTKDIFRFGKTITYNVAHAVDSCQSKFTLKFENQFGFGGPYSNQTNSEYCRYSNHQQDLSEKTWNVDIDFELNPAQACTIEILYSGFEFVIGKVNFICDPSRGEGVQLGANFSK